MTLRTSPLSNSASKTSSRAGLGCAIPFGLLFAAIGLAAFWFLTLRPLMRVSASAHWIETPCEIIASELEQKSDSDSTTYRVAIRYRYEFGGHPYETDRYDFSEGSSNVGVNAMRATVQAHPPGHQTVCYVEPSDPATAVLNRDVPSAAWFGILTLAFPFFGTLLVFFAWRATKRERAEARSPLGNATTRAAPSIAGPRKFARGRGRTVGPLTALTPDASEPVVPGEVLLKPTSGRIAVFIGVGFFALFWNGILGLAMRDLIGDGVAGVEWFVVLFLTPFFVIGLGMIGVALQTFARLFAPAVEVTLDPSQLRLGNQPSVRWRLTARGVRKLSIHLIGREEATYQQGTSTTTDRSEFLRALVFESTDPLGLLEGRAELPLPSDAAAPAFSTQNNRLVYELAFSGDIPWRADVQERFLLCVRGPVRTAHPLAIPQPVPHSGGGFTLWSVENFQPGDTLVCTLAREATANAGATGPLTLQLGWFTEGRGTRNAAISWSQSIPLPEPGTDLSFEIPLPDSPWSFAGSLLAVAWRLELLDAKGEPLIAVPLVVAPGGQVVDLPALPKEDLRRLWRK